MIRLSRKKNNKTHTTRLLRAETTTLNTGLRFYSIDPLGQIFGVA